MTQFKKLNNHTKGDTLDVKKFELVYDVNGDVVDLTNATIRIQFRKRNKYGKLAKEFSVGSGITVTDATNGKFQIDQTNSFITEPDIYYYDIEITFPTGEITTVLYGTILVTQDVSY